MTMIDTDPQGTGVIMEESISLEPKEKWVIEKITDKGEGVEGYAYNNNKGKIYFFCSLKNHRGRGQNKLEMSAEMTGRERIDYERWSEMKDAADK